MSKNNNDKESSDKYLAKLARKEEIENENYLYSLKITPKMKADQFLDLAQLNLRLYRNRIDKIRDNSQFPLNNDDLIAIHELVWPWFSTVLSQMDEFYKSLKQGCENGRNNKANTK